MSTATEEQVALTPLPDDLLKDIVLLLANQPWGVSNPLMVRLHPFIGHLFDQGE